MSTKQISIFNNQCTYQLVSGPVLSGKTYGVMHKVVRHMWDVEGAKVAVIAKTVKSAKHGGSYGILIDVIIPEWERSGLVGNHPDIKFGYFDKSSTPRLAGDTRTNHFTLRNRFGGKSEFFLFSLDYDKDVEEKFKNTTYSCFWLIELTNFGDDDGDRLIWRTTSARLRTPGLPMERHLWIADTNPSDEGEDNTWYRLFYDKAGFDPVKHAWMIKNISVTEVMIEDNPWLSETQIEKIKAENAHDQALYARNVEGKWVAANKGGHFGDIFLPNVHVRGDLTKVNRSEWEVIIPGAGTTDFLTGLDPGDVNKSFHIAVKRPVGENDYAYDYIDEFAVIGKMVSIEDFTDVVIGKMDYWERVMLEEHGITALNWKHWSDSSAFEFNAGLKGTEAKLIYTYSRERIKLLAVDKPKGSKRERVNTWRRLMFSNRLFISAQLTGTIQMVRNLKKGTNAAEFISEAGGWKHRFDSASYIQAGEEPIETTQRMPRSGMVKSSYVSVAA